MKVGDMVKRINWKQIFAADSDKMYPLEPMNGVIIDIVSAKEYRNRREGQGDFMVFWESGNISQLDDRGIEKIRPSHEVLNQERYEDDEERLEFYIQDAKYMDEYERQKYGCQCRGCDIQRDRFPNRQTWKDPNGLYVTRPGCIHVGFKCRCDSVRCAGCAKGWGIPGVRANIK
jgi:hypothetical protein